MKPKAIICDIDGTLALRPVLGRDPYDMSRVSEDLVRPETSTIVALMWEAGFDVIFCSGRDETAREDTAKWIKNNVHVSAFLLLMREKGDGRKDAEVKQEMLDRHILPDYDVFCVFDDRRQVVQMWRANGLTVFDVADGDF